MDKMEKAAELFAKGFNCAQSVFSVLALSQGIEEKTAFRIATAFGGGIARTGQICGAVTGALMAIGLKKGMTDPLDQNTKEATYAASIEFFNKFKTKHGSIICNDLLGCDISDPKNKEKLKLLHNDVCPKFVRDAVEIAEKMLK